MSFEVSEELVELMWSFCVLMVGFLTVCSQKPERSRKQSGVKAVFFVSTVAI